MPAYSLIGLMLVLFDSPGAVAETEPEGANTTLPETADQSPTRTDEESTTTSETESLEETEEETATENEDEADTANAEKDIKVKAKLDSDRRPVHVFEEYRYIYGFPPDYIGGQIGTVFIQNETCQANKIEEHNRTECRMAIIQSYCHFNETVISLLKNKAREFRLCPLQATKDKDITSTYEPINFAVVSQPLKQGLGQYDVDRQIKYREFFETCAKNPSQLTTVGGILLCDHKGFLEIYNGKRIAKKHITWDMSGNNWFGLYLYWFCRVSLPLMQERFKNNSELKAHPFCPNPCSIRRSVCSQIEHTLPTESSSNELYAFSQDNCLKLGKGTSLMEYECLCAPGYKWNPNSRTCGIENLCASRSPGPGAPKRDPCSKQGTIRCVTIPPEEPGVVLTEEKFMIQRLMRDKPQCICRPGFMGPRCERQKDACIESPSPGQVPGKQACREYMGNICHSQNGTNYYFCHCTEAWTNDNSYSFPNCYKKKSICDRIICQNRGLCVGSPGQNAFGCLCEEGWTGSRCQFPDVRHWLPWGSWTTCSAPFCAGLGWHSRIRECRVPVNESTGFGLCVGNRIEYRPCKSGCIYPVRAYIPMIKVIVMFGCCLLLLQFVVSLVYALLRMSFM